MDYIYDTIPIIARTIEFDIKSCMSLRGVSRLTRTIINKIYPDLSEGALFRANGSLALPRQDYLNNGYRLYSKMELNMYMHAKGDVKDYVGIYKGSTDAIIHRHSYIKYNIEKISYHDSKRCISKVEKGLYFIKYVYMLDPPVFEASNADKEDFYRIYCGYPCKVTLSSLQVYLSSIKLAYCPISILPLYSSKDDLIKACLNCCASKFSEITFLSYDEKRMLFGLGSYRLSYKDINKYINMAASRLQLTMNIDEDLYVMSIDLGWYE